MAGIGQDLKKIYSDETRIVENASLCSGGVFWGQGSTGSIFFCQKSVDLTSTDLSKIRHYLKTESVSKKSFSKNKVIKNINSKLSSNYSILFLL